MLRSLPVADPESLYRIGDGNDCCVASGPQDRWGLYSFSLFEKLKAALPEFEQVAAFQGGGWRLSVRRASVDRLSRPLRSEFVTGNYFSTFGIRGFGGRLISEVDDRSAAPPVAVLQPSAHGKACMEAIQRWSARATSLTATRSRLSALLRPASTVKHCAAIRRISGCRFSKSLCFAARGRCCANRSPRGCG